MHTSRILNEGRLVGIQGIAQDITQRKEAEARFRRIFEATLNVLYTTNLEGEILDMNPAGLSLFGFQNLDEAKKTNIKTLYANLDDQRKLIELAEQGPIRTSRPNSRKQMTRQLKL